MPVSAELLLAVVALVNSLAAAMALIIHALRVPYREGARGSPGTQPPLSPPAFTDPRSPG